MKLVVLTPEQLRAIVREAVSEALRPPQAPASKLRRRPARALPPDDPQADRQLAEELRRRGLA